MVSSEIKAVLKGFSVLLATDLGVVGLTSLEGTFEEKIFRGLLAVAFIVAMTGQFGSFLNLNSRLKP